MRKVLLSLVALVATILGAKAQIVYTNLESTPIVLNSAKTDTTINFFGGTEEFAVQHYYATDPSAASFFACMAEGSEVVSTNASYNANVDLLSENTVIGASSTFFGSGDGSPYFNVLLSTEYTTWLDKTGYVGFKFKHNSNTHYGWAKLKVTAAEITIYGYAYQSTANTQIKAGDKGVTSSTETIADNLSFDFYPNPAHNYLIINSVSSVRNVIITDISGKEIGKYEVADNTLVDISSLEKGVYFIRLDSTNKQVIKKFVKE